MRKILLAITLVPLATSIISACTQGAQMEMDWGGYSAEEKQQICADFQYARSLSNTEMQQILDDLEEQDGGPHWDAAEFRSFIDEKC